MVANYFEITVKSKSGNNISVEINEIMGRIHENYDLNYDLKDCFYPAGHYDSGGKPMDDMYRVEFEAEDYSIEDALVDFLREITDEYHDLAFEILQTFEGDSYYRHIIADGEHEEHQGEIVYPANERLKYFD